MNRPSTVSRRRNIQSRIIVPVNLLCRLYLPVDTRFLSSVATTHVHLEVSQGFRKSMLTVVVNVSRLLLAWAFLFMPTTAHVTASLLDKMYTDTSRCRSLSHSIYDGIKSYANTNDVSGGLGEPLAPVHVIHGKLDIHITTIRCFRYIEMFVNIPAGSCRGYQYDVRAAQYAWYSP